MIRIRIPDPVYIYGSGIRIQIQGNDMDSTDPDSPHWCGVEDPYFFDRAGSKLFSSDPGSGSEKGLVRNQINPLVPEIFFCEFFDESLDSCSYR